MSFIRVSLPRDAERVLIFKTSRRAAGGGGVAVHDENHQRVEVSACKDVSTRSVLHFALDVKPENSSQAAEAQQAFVEA